MPRFRSFDASGREPRPAQIEILNWLDRVWDKSNVFGIIAGTGVGKSAISRAIQVEFGNTAVLIPTNNLINQQMVTYPNVNFLKGKHNYKCSRGEEDTCGDTASLRIKPCDNCPYIESRNRAREGEDTIFNPISYFYYSRSDDFRAPEILVIDEAHKLKEMIMMLTECQFRKGRYLYPTITNTIELIDWMSSTIKEMKEAVEALLSSKEYKEAKSLARQMESVRMTRNAIQANPQNFVFYTKEMQYRKTLEEYLVVSPIVVPKALIDQVLQATKVVLMSATLLESDIRDLGFKSYLFLDAGSPIPKANRPVYYKPADFKMNFEASPEAVANWVKSVLSQYPNRNTIVHLSYGWSKKLARFFDGALINTPETKDKVLATFKKMGGLWLASGAAEGIDLPGDECRLNIIPFVIMANPFDPVVKKQLALPNGQLKYELQALKQVIQQAGRSTRGVDDASITVIGDSKFIKLFNKNRNYLPKSFAEAVNFRSPK